MGLNAEGLFRLSGNRERVEHLQKMYDLGEPVDLEAEKDPHVISSLLKGYFRELPEPLLTTDLYSEFINAYDKDDRQKSTKQLVEVLKKLPQPNKILLKFLITLLASAARANNLMTSANLAICFAPNLFRSDMESPDLILTHSPIYNSIVRLFIDEADVILLVL
eukprot:TRINITY_DN747_c0_g1_i3.p1 TRINITY_DN747_c0_g1~~TRINITY_DN747_c0_g1_i3.p1  ORF type:complete len:164 (-),score=22.99 TRINITY_DN747_c0_g1_i3:87-578(-)